MSPLELDVVDLAVFDSSSWTLELDGNCALLDAAGDDAEGGLNLRKSTLSLGNNVFCVSLAADLDSSSKADGSSGILSLSGIVVSTCFSSSVCESEFDDYFLLGPWAYIATRGLTGTVLVGCYDGSDSTIFDF